MAAAAYALDRWFFAGLTASKWIGLPQYASAMKELQAESRIWGIAALIIESLALALALPHWPKQKPEPQKNSDLSLATERNLSREYIMRCVFHSGLCVLGTVVFAILVPLIANFFGKATH
ncbi:MAG: hypothetical protein WCE61_21745 [Candidatus Acidiferrum sp.]